MSFITLLLLNSVATYAEWLPVRSNNNKEKNVYVDLDSIRRKGDLVKMWQLHDYKTTRTANGISYLSAKAQFQYDCAEERLRLLAYLQYSDNMGRGELVFSTSTEVQWTPVPPGTIGQILWAVACKKKWSRPAVSADY